MIPSSLQTDGRHHPRELDHRTPTLSWKYLGDGHIRTQTIEVELNDPTTGAWTAIWAKTADADVRCVRLPDVLAPFTMYRWSVTAATGGGSSGTEVVRGTGHFETGFLDEPWTAQWIHRGSSGGDVEPPKTPLIERSFRTAYSLPPAQFRTGFELDHPPIAARLYISAHGIYQARINGQRVGHDELTPGWTSYSTRLEYQAYDVTHLLRSGANALGATVADGWWAGYLGYNTRRHADQYGSRPELIAELHLLEQDGSTRIVRTDDTWTEHPGHIVMADLLMGEYHDGRNASPGWDTAAFDDSAWRTAGSHCRGREVLKGQSAEPVRVHSRVPARSITPLPDGEVIVDFGQNLVGRIRLTLVGQPAGSVVRIRHGEMLDGGRLYTANLRTAEAEDALVASGVDGEVFEPQFTLHGFRYAAITGLTGELRHDDILAVVLTSDNSETGTFSTGSDLVNQLHSNIVWGQRGNYVAVPTDCPQRDERLGWTADTQVFARTGVFNADINAFLTRWLADLASSQHESGRVPDVVPLPPTSENFFEGAPGWGDAAVIVPWVLYEEYGDLGVLEHNYPMMRAWVDYVAERNPGSLWVEARGNNYGDWLSVDEVTPTAFVAAAYQIRSTDILAAAAYRLGEERDHARYSDRSRALRELFAEQFLDDGSVKGDTQTAYLMTLGWDLAPAAERDRLADRLVELIEERGRRLTSGFLGIGLLLPVLTKIGRDDLAASLLMQRRYPSWGYSIDRGATTIWERWDGYTTERGFQDIGMNSFNHYSLGSVGEWLYRSVAGIDQLPGSIGYRTVLFKPSIIPELSPVEASFDSPRGRISTSWTAQGVATISLPPGTSARIVLPGIDTLVSAGEHTFHFTPDHHTNGGI